MEHCTVSSIAETFNEEDLVALSKSLEQQQQQQQQKTRQQKETRNPNNRPKRDVVVCIPPDDNTDGHPAAARQSTLTWKYGESLLDLAKSIQGQGVFGELDNLEGPCGGQMNCSTCHVYLDPTTYKALEAPLEAALDMLDLAFDKRMTSRLGCQVKFSDSLIGSKLEEDHDIVVTLPSGVNNVWES